MLLILGLGTLAILVATLLPLSRNPHWVVRGLDFPRLQLALLAALLLLAAILFLDLHRATTLGLIALLVCCLAWHLWWVMPYTRLWPVEVRASVVADPNRRLGILVANVLQTNRDADRLLALVRQHRPDILVTLESDAWWQERLDSFEPEMPHTIKCPLDNLYGMHVYSRLPLSDTDICFLVEEDVPSMHCLAELPSGDRLRMHFLHPAPPSPTENTASAERDAELVLTARSVRESELPVIVTGDLNDVAWSATTHLFRKISGLLDPRVGRGLFNTFHADYPCLRWPLDHIFHSSQFTLESIQRLPAIGSDHFPLFARLIYTPLHGAGQQGLAADESDHLRAKEIADREGVDVDQVPRPAS